MRKFFFLTCCLFGCVGWISVHPAVGTAVRNQDECFTVKTANLVITSSSCGKKDGSISGILVEGDGKLAYTWRDALNNIVGNNLDLKNISSGPYTLTVRGEENCTPVTLPPITVDEKDAIDIDKSKISILPAGCDNKGSVTGIKVTGASRLEWKSFNTGEIVSTTQDLLNVPIGLYKLTAYNETGCTKDGGTYNVGSQLVLPVVDKVVIEDPTCNVSAGKVTLTLTLFSDQENLLFFVLDEAGRQLFDGILVYNSNNNPVTITLKPPPGNYRMFVRGRSGCDVQLSKFSVAKGELSLVNDSIGVANDQCNQHIGHILGIALKGGTKPGKGRIVEWTDANGKPVGGNFPYLTNIGAGVYKMHYTDPLGCELTAVFSVGDDSPSLSPPQLHNLERCLPGKVQFSVDNPDVEGSYRLYRVRGEDTVAIGKSATGKFEVSVIETTEYFVSYMQGVCESSKTRIIISVAAPGVLVPNTFTPNGDGINDYWNIASINDFPGSKVTIYNRYGHIVFVSVDYSKPFDGRMQGKDLPEGVYYYVIEIPVAACAGKIKGSITLLR